MPSYIPNQVVGYSGQQYKEWENVKVNQNWQS